MSEDSIIPKTVNPDIQKERNNATFNVEEFANWWSGGADNLKLKRELEEYVYKDITEHGTLFHYKSYEDIYDYSVKQSLELATKLREFQQKHNPGGDDIWPKMITALNLNGSVPSGIPFSVHFGMVLNVLKNQGTDEFYEEFGKQAETLEISSAYGQTELGHGTFLRGLETRADYDRKTEEFVLNTPSITAYKWWPGGLGHSANYCLVAAQLYIDEEPKGIHMFFVPIRDKNTHVPLPGVDVGDIGGRMGFYGVNNGFLGLKNVRVPRKNMLMRNSQVHADGTYVKSPVSVLTYFGMVYVRSTICRSAAIMLTMASTIATRYSAVRRQSPINPNEPEPQIIDHVTQQLKLFPEIATGVAFRLASDYVTALYNQTAIDITQGEYLRLPELHALTCSMKAICSYDSSDGVERLRMGCGGHGYLTSSNLGPLYASATAACTYEGENAVLLLQAGRFLMKTWRHANANKPLAPTVAYIGEVVKNKNFGKWTGSWDNIVKAMQYTTVNKIRITFENFSQRLKSGQTDAEASNNSGIEYSQAAQLHGRSFICATFLEEVCGVNSKQRSPALNKVLENLLELYLVNTILKHLGDILRVVELTDADLRALQIRLENVLKEIRPDAVAICDGFDYHDKLLSSSLGSYDGNAYERIFELAKKSPLNQTPVPKAFDKYLKPFMKSNL